MTLRLLSFSPGPSKVVVEEEEGSRRRSEAEGKRTSSQTQPFFPPATIIIVDAIESIILHRFLQKPEVALTFLSFKFLHVPTSVLFVKRIKNQLPVSLIVVSCTIALCTGVLCTPPAICALVLPNGKWRLPPTRRGSTFSLDTELS